MCGRLHYMTNLPPRPQLSSTTGRGMVKSQRNGHDHSILMVLVIYYILQPYLLSVNVPSCWRAPTRIWASWVVSFFLALLEVRGFRVLNVHMSPSPLAIQRLISGAWGNGVRRAFYAAGLGVTSASRAHTRDKDKTQR